MKYIDWLFSIILRGNKKCLLIWDSASTRRAIDMKHFLSQRKIDQVMIPSGCTAYIQSLDIVINKPFKDYIREEINLFVAKEQQRNEKGNLIKHSCQQVCKWIKCAWD